MRSAIALLLLTLVMIAHAADPAPAAPGAKPALFQKPFLFIVPVQGRPAQALLDEHLRNGWRVVSATPLGGSDGTHYMAVFILERDRPPQAGEPWFDERHAVDPAPVPAPAPNKPGKPDPKGPTL